MKPLFSTSILTLLVSLSALNAHAQPDVAQAPKADNPVNRAPRGLRFDLKSIFKPQFTRLGADDATSDLLATFVQGELQARQDLTAKAQPLQTALRAEALTDTQIATLLNTYQGVLEDDKVRHDKAVADLGKAVDLKKMPKIEATLTLMGVIGDGPMINIGAMGGMGGGRRGIMGGMGGQGFGGAFGGVPGMGGMGQGGMGMGQGGRGQARGNRNNQGNGNVLPAQGA